MVVPHALLTVVPGLLACFVLTALEAAAQEVRKVHPEHVDDEIAASIERGLQITSSALRGATDAWRGSGSYGVVSDRDDRPGRNGA